MSEKIANWIDWLNRWMPVVNAGVMFVIGGVGAYHLRSVGVFSAWFLVSILAFTSAIRSMMEAIDRRVQQQGYWLLLNRIRFE